MAQKQGFLARPPVPKLGSVDNPAGFNCTGWVAVGLALERRSDSAARVSGAGPLSSRSRERSTAARALAVDPTRESGERTGLWHCHDCAESQRSAMGIMAVRDAAN